MGKPMLIDPVTPKNSSNSLFISELKKIDETGLN